MKKVQMLVVALAVVLAAGSAFSAVESRRTVIYYQSSSPGADCDVEFLEDVCPEGNGAQCQIGTPALYISKRENGGDCEMLKRP